MRVEDQIRAQQDRIAWLTGRLDKGENRADRMEAAFQSIIGTVVPLAQKGGEPTAVPKPIASLAGGEAGVIGREYDGQTGKCKETLKSSEFGVAIAKSRYNDFPCGTVVTVESAVGRRKIQTRIVDVFDDAATAGRIVLLTEATAARIGLTLDQGIMDVLIERVELPA